jgi:hypothetical protein
MQGAHVAFVGVARKRGNRNATNNQIENDAHKRMAAAGYSIRKLFVAMSLILYLSTDLSADLLDRYSFRDIATKCSPSRVM